MIIPDVLWSEKVAENNRASSSGELQSPGNPVGVPPLGGNCSRKTA
jgi:hypothetical protein